MQLTDKDLEILDAYFEETLPETDRHNLEKRLANESDFARLAYTWLSKRTGLEAIKLREQKVFLASVNAKMPPVPNQLTPIRYWKWAAVAASIVGLITFSLNIFNNLTPSKQPNKMSVFYVPFMDGNMGSDAREEAIKTYKKGDYEKAIPLFTQAFAEKSDTMMLFYKGVAAVGAEKSTIAIEVLESLQTSQVVPIELIPYYLGLAYAQNGERDKALLLLKKAANTEGLERRDEAKAALQFLESEQNK